MGVDSFQNRALEIVSSGKVRTAFDLEREARSLRVRYEDGHFIYGPHPGRSLLLARRLIEAGVSVVTACLSGWDTHRANFSTLRDLVPPLDEAVHALVTDLEERGLLDDVAILMGENSAARRGSATSRPTAAATGPTPVFSGWPSAACGPVRSSARPTPAVKK